MKKQLPRIISAVLLAICGFSSTSCYYPVQGRGYDQRGSAYNQDSKGGDAAPVDPGYAPGPRYVGVDPALAVAGVAAAGLLGYAIGNHHSHHHYHGGGYYRPAPYGYYGGYCR